MLCCSECNYFKMLSSGIDSSICNKFMCEYSDYIFPNNIDELNEYPCNLPAVMQGNA
ncbi:MAG: hypothetical protein Q8920_02130 [Bacillota bacterium]|nr:hypothetical protein [Bacillota bacterium]